jgi:hypothetical protein
MANRLNDDPLTRTPSRSSNVSIYYHDSMIVPLTLSSRKSDATSVRLTPVHQRSMMTMSTINDNIQRTKPAVIIKQEIHFHNEKLDRQRRALSVSDAIRRSFSMSLDNIDDHIRLSNTFILSLSLSMCVCVSLDM